jgi:hypothetical protein
VDIFHVGLANGPRTVLLSGSAGWGKTRIVHEFYQEIAAEQDSPYWPKHIFASTSDPVLRRRKRSYPAISGVPPDVRLPWMWWGLNGVRSDDGTYLRTIRQEDHQWFVHGQSLDKRLPARWRVFGAAKSALASKRAPLVASVLGCFLWPVGMGGAIFSGLEEGQILRLIDEHGVEDRAGPETEHVSQ